MSGSSPAMTLQRLVARTTGERTEDDNKDTSSSVSHITTQALVNEDSVRDLRLLFLGCESQPPYGPYEHTAQLFLDLITLALNTIGATEYRVLLDVYHVSNGNFPPRSAYVDYDGIILPGSFSAAYDDSQPWIQELTIIIQEELVTKNIPTLGVCFGHQIYAHSFFGKDEGGSAIRCPAGPQAGRQVSQLSVDGKKWFSSKNQKEEIEGDDDDDVVQFFYTHGDMVESLPPQGRVLYGTESVPIQGAIYYMSTTTTTTTTAMTSSHEESKTQDPKPIAITIQAHPEYASSRSLGLHGTLYPIMDAMCQRKDIVSEEELHRGKVDAEREFETVQQCSLQTMIMVGRLLGWFPKDE